MWPSAGANGHDGRGGEHSGGGRDLSGDLARGAPGSQPPPNGRGSYSMLLGQQAERGVSGLGGFLHGQQFAGYASHQQPQLDYGPGRPAFSYSGLSLQSQPPPSLYLGQLQHPLGSLYRPPSAATSGLGPDALSSLSGNSAQPSPFAQNSNRGPESESNFLLSKDAADYFNASMALNNYRMSLAQLGGPIAAGHAQPGSAAFPPPLNPGLPPNASMMAHQYPPPHPGDPSNPIPSLPPFRFENDYGQPAQNPRQQQQQQPEMREAAEQQEADSKDSPEEAPVSSPSEDPEDSGSEEYRPRGGRRRGRLPKRSFAGSGRPKADPSPGGGKAKTHVCDVCGMAFGSSGHLSRHAYIHKPDNLKPHKCPIEGCERRFPRSDNMRVHYRAHLKQLEREGRQAERPLPHHAQAPPISQPPPPQAHHMYQMPGNPGGMGGMGQYPGQPGPPQGAMLGLGGLGLGGFSLGSFGPMGSMGNLGPGGMGGGTNGSNGMGPGGGF